MGLSAEEQKEMEALELAELEALELAELEALEKESGGAPGAILDEAHPAFASPRGMMTRAAYKNFGKGLSYLKKEYPELEWKMDESGEPLAKTPEEKDWRKLDPSSLELQDVSDIAYDIPTGIVQGIGTTAAGLAGGVATLPAGGWGAIPAAMAASGGISAGTEALRQGIGKMFGIREEIDPSEIALSGGIGALIPGGFGTGAGAKEIAKTALKSGVSQQALKTSQSGALRKYVAPKLGAAVSGISESLINKAKQILPILKKPGLAGATIPKKMDAIQDTVVESVRDSQKEIGSQIGKMHKIAGEQLSETVEGAIPTETLIQPLLKLKAEIQAEGLESPQTTALIAEIDSVINSIFTKPKEVVEEAGDGALAKLDKMLGLEEAPKTEWEMPAAISMENAWQAYHQLKGKLQDFGGNLAKAGTVEGVAGKAATVTDKRIVGAIGEMRKNIKQTMEDKIRASAEQNFKHEENRSIRAYVQADKNMDFDPPSAEQVYEMTKAISGGKGWKAAVKEAGDAAVEEYRLLNESFSEMGDLIASTKNAVKSPEAVYSMLKRAQSNPMVRDRMKTLSQVTGVDLENEAITLKAMQTFGAKSAGEKALEDTKKDVVSRRTPLAALAGYGGWAAARAAGAGIMESGAAAGLAAKAGWSGSSPDALRKYMQLGEFGAEQVAPMLRYTPWMLQEPINKIRGE